MKLAETFFHAMMRTMKTELTPIKVRAAASAKDMTLRAFLAHANVSRAVFWRWERGLTKPHALTLHRLEKAVR